MLCAHTSPRRWPRPLRSTHSGVGPKSHSHFRFVRLATGLAILYHIRRDDQTAYTSSFASRDTAPQPFTNSDRPNEYFTDKLVDNKQRVEVRLVIRSDKTVGPAVCLPPRHQPQAQPQLQPRHPVRLPLPPAASPSVSIRQIYPHCPAPSRSQRRRACSTSSKNLTARARRGVSVATLRRSLVLPQRTTGTPAAIFSPARPQTCSARTPWTARRRTHPTSTSPLRRQAHTATLIP